MLLSIACTDTDSFLTIPRKGHQNQHHSFSMNYQVSGKWALSFEKRIDPVDTNLEQIKGVEIFKFFVFLFSVFKENITVSCIKFAILV